VILKFEKNLVEIFEVAKCLWINRMEYPRLSGGLFYPGARRGDTGGLRGYIL